MTTSESTAASDCARARGVARFGASRKNPTRRWVGRLLRFAVELPGGVWIVVLVIVSLVLEVPGSIAAVVRV